MIGRNANVGDQLLLGLRRGQCLQGKGCVGIWMPSGGQVWKFDVYGALDAPKNGL